MTPAFNVLFLCTRNSARSIMAEAILNRFGKFRAYSAGSDPAGRRCPRCWISCASWVTTSPGLRSKSWALVHGP